jgi:hypothetical protein
MAAPVTTVRSLPAGIKMDDGFSTVIAFARDPDIEFWEKQVQPPGVDGGDAIETTTMHNILWRTMAPRQLRTLTEFTITAAYDPVLYNSILNILNISDSITIHFPDGSTLDFFGYLKFFEPGEHVEGEQPEATITIVPTNFDFANDVEADPVLTEVAGT